jgi:hypothetical protein
MEPAATVVRKLGGPSKVAAILGIHRTRVSNWMRPKESGGTGGRIPQDHHRALLTKAQEIGESITAEDLLPKQEHAPAPEPERVAS